MKNLSLKKILLIFVVPFLFLFFGILTLKDYGINWDEPFHFYRGQAYLHYFLTGEKDYSSLPAYPRVSSDCPSWAGDSCSLSPGGATDILNTPQKGPIYEDAINKLQENFKTKRSFFQHDLFPYEDIVKNEDGHPPTGDILAALTNYVFYQKLGIMKDIESHHLAEVLIAFLIVVGVGFFVYLNWGLFPSIIASSSLALYPLFFSESHFNIKDPVLASFFGLTVITFYFGIVFTKWRLLVISALFLGLGTGVKFNTVFIPLIVIPWLFLFLFNSWISRKRKRADKKKIISAVVALIAYPLIAALIFYVLWPFLWGNPENILKILKYYRQIGAGVPGDMGNYLIRGFNTYPVLWIIYTTPVPILLFSLVGIIRSSLSLFKRNDRSLLVLLWFFIPIVRVTLPNTVIYGGVRQIMEFVPAMAILSGIGADTLIQITKKVFAKKVVAERLLEFVILSSLVFVLVEMIKIHPNQNVYFNQLIGGLSGARDKNIPYWGNSYGNAYLQGINWLNENAEPNAKLGLPLSTMGNLPKLKLRADIDFYNRHWSGTNRNGEYEIEMDFNWSLRNWYSFQYYEKYLDPVYVAEVDGVPILKVWKNDLEHTKTGFESESRFYPKDVSVSKDSLKIDLGKTIFLTKLTVEHSKVACQQTSSGYIALSEDGVNWTQMPEALVPQVPPALDIFDEDTFVYFFAAEKARYILLDPQNANSCLVKSPVADVRGLTDLP